MARTWQRVRVTVPTERVPAVGERLHALGTLGFEERAAGGTPRPHRQPWDTGPPPPPPEQTEIIAWFEDDDLAPERVRALLDLAPLDDRVAEGDWEEGWRTTFRPLRVAPGLLIAPPWDAPPGAVVVEPGMAFGTGDHPTTRACLEAVARVVRPGMRVLDVGTGSGILALAAARLGAWAEGVDNDPDAVRQARENAIRNDLPCRFHHLPLAALTGTWDLVVANIFAEALVRLSADILRLTGGRLVVAGVLADREPLVTRAFGTLAPGGRRQDGEWVSLEWVRP